MKHHYIAIVTIPLMESEAQQINKTGVLDRDYHVMGQPVDVGCATCELPLHEAINQECADHPPKALPSNNGLGGDTGTLPSGDNKETIQ